MALTAARGFSGGPMSDIDYGQVASPASWVESASAFAVTQPNAGTRTVTIAAGYASGHGIRVQNDAAISQALSAPGSGSQWFLVTLRRDWNTKTASLQVLAGATSGGTTTPTAPPTVLPAGFQSTPGGQHDQPLAWVWASSATTTLTIFDVRMGTFGRQITALTAASLALLALHTSPPIGAVIPCLTDGFDYRWHGSTLGWAPVSSLLTSCSLQLNGQRATDTNGGDLAWDTVLSDPSTMRNGVGIKALWKGRYAIQCRIAVQGNIPNSDQVILDCVDAGGIGAAFSKVGQWGLPGDTNMQLVDEITLNAGTTIRFRMSWTGASGARNFSYGDDSVQARMSARYLGPA